MFFKPLDGFISLLRWGGFIGGMKYSLKYNNYKNMNAIWKLKVFSFYKIV